MTEEFRNEKLVIAVVGLGYVGLPLAIAISEKYDVLGFDTDPLRINELIGGRDRTDEVDSKFLTQAKRFTPTTSAELLTKADFIIITVPTPVDENNVPDLGPLSGASKTVGAHMKNGVIVVYESTVFPGATEDVCVPILERSSGMKLHIDFHVGYSPERVNPGDKMRKVIDIVKVTSASSVEALERVDQLYRSVITAGTYRASSIKVAEASKVIENAQRDVNIAFVNELSKIFHVAGINTAEVLKAASTKWNFMQFSPGLVGGHCIGVDPYYLTNKAETLGYYPELLLAARRINESMASFIAKEFSHAYLRRRILCTNRDVLILGATFKENCPDVRNSKIFDLFRSLRDLGFQPEIVDPIADPEEVLKTEHIKLEAQPSKSHYVGVILAVSHDTFRNQTIDQIKNLLMIDGLFFDLKAVFDKKYSDFQL